MTYKNNSLQFTVKEPSAFGGFDYTIELVVESGSIGIVVVGYVRKPIEISDYFMRFSVDDPAEVVLSSPYGKKMRVFEVSSTADDILLSEVNDLPDGNVSVQLRVRDGALIDKLQHIRLTIKCAAEAIVETFEVDVYVE